MNQQNNVGKLLPSRKKTFILLLVLMVAIVSVTFVWQAYRPTLANHNVSGPIINPIVNKVIDKSYKEWGSELKELLARNLTDTVTILQNDNNFYGSHTEIKTALNELAKGNIVQIKALFIKASQKSGLDNKRTAEIQQNLGAIMYLEISPSYNISTDFDSWTPILEKYTHVIKLDSENINGWRNIGYLIFHFAENETNRESLLQGLPQEVIVGVKSTTNNYEKYNELFNVAVTAYNKAITLAEKQNNPLELARAYCDLGNIYKSKQYGVRDDDKILSSYEKALTLYQDLNIKEGMAEMYSKIGFLYQFNFNIYDKAFEYYGKAIALDEIIGDKKDMAQIYSSMSLLYGMFGDFKKAIEVTEKEISLRESIGAIIYQDRYESLARYYERLGNLDKSIYYYQKVLAESEKTEGSDGLISSYLGSLGSIYLKRGELDKALSFYQRALAINQKAGQKQDIAASYYYLGDVYMKMGDKNQAQQAFQKSLEIFKQTDNLSFLKKIEDQLAVLLKQPKP